MTGTPRESPDEIPRRVTNLERRLEEMDDLVSQRCLAVLGVADELHRQTNERFNLVNQQLDTLTQSVQQLVVNAERDRQTFQTEIRRIWEYLLQERPNGTSEGE